MGKRVDELIGRAIIIEREECRTTELEVDGMRAHNPGMLKLTASWSFHIISRVAPYAQITAPVILAQTRLNL